MDRRGEESCCFDTIQYISGTAHKRSLDLLAKAHGKGKKYLVFQFCLALDLNASTPFT